MDDESLNHRACAFLQMEMEMGSITVSRHGLTKVVCRCPVRPCQFQLVLLCWAMPCPFMGTLRSQYSTVDSFLFVFLRYVAHFGCDSEPKVGLPSIKSGEPNMIRLLYLC